MSERKQVFTVTVGVLDGGASIPQVREFIATAIRDAIADDVDEADDIDVQFECEVT